MMTLDPELDALGRALHEALAEELASGAEAATTESRRTHRRLGRLRSHPRALAAVAALAVAVPSAAAAAGLFDSPQQVAASMPAGTLALGGTDPSCTVVTQGVEYHCTLGRPPSDDGGPPAGQWKGTVEPTVDQTQHVNGGCRSLDAAGTMWECYLGETAVRQQIIGRSFLGQRETSPGVG